MEYTCKLTLTNQKSYIIVRAQQTGYSQLTQCPLKSTFWLKLFRVKKCFAVQVQVLRLRFSMCVAQIRTKSCEIYIPKSQQTSLSTVKNFDRVSTVESYMECNTHATACVKMTTANSSVPLYTTIIIVYRYIHLQRHIETRQNNGV